jgi:Predicted esterase
MMKFRNLILLIALSVAGFVNAAVVDTVQTTSAAMQKKIKAVVITPEDYSSAKELPVVYLLHGYSGDYKDWVTKVKDLVKLVDQYNLIVVCPDGANSWYFDSPIDKKSQYETYISSELVSWIDKNYKTIKNRKGRAITGLSMGGHGALYLAFRHQDIFGAAGSMSGGVDIRPFTNNWEIVSWLGKYAENPENWEKNTVVNLLNLLTPNSLALIVDCGTEDFFFQVNKNLHEQLLYRNIPHDYIARPGSHNWNYWSNSIKYQLLFFSDFFQKG